MNRKKIPFMTILISVLLATTALADIPDTAHTDGYSCGRIYAAPVA